MSRTPRYVKLIALLIADEDTPSRAKAMLVGAIAYTASPLDLVPGVIPVLGQLDDLLVPLLILRKALALSPAAVRVRHLKAQGLTLANIDNDILVLSRPYRAAGARARSVIARTYATAFAAVSSAFARGHRSAA